MRGLFPSDDDLLSAPARRRHRPTSSAPTLVLSSLKGQLAEYRLDNKILRVPLALRGIYNAYNAAGALALVHAILPDVHPLQLTAALGKIKSAFGRGEEFTVAGASVELILVKNPSAFQLSLASFVEPGYRYMIAINDHYADGRDMSWLWNVDFTSLPGVDVVSGLRAADMALRLQYDEIRFDLLETNLESALTKLVQVSEPNNRGRAAQKYRIFATYTAMLELRKIIKGKSIL
jgi:UDP-N-acetylmuramyl tripeptide synthase